MHSGNRSMALSFKQTSSSLIYLHMHSRTHTHTQSANSFFSLHIGKEASHCTLSSLHTLMIIGHNISSPLPICSPWMTCSSLSLPLCLKLHQQEEKSKNHLIYFSTMCKCLSQFEEWSIFSLRLLLYAFRSGCAHSHIHTKATEVWLYTSTCSTHKHICTRAGVNSYYSPLEYMTETEEVWSGNGVFCLMSSLFQTHVHTHTETRGPEVLIIQCRPLDNPVLMLRWNTTSKGPFPFELMGFCRETVFDREREKSDSTVILCASCLARISQPDLPTSLHHMCRI